MAAVARCTAPGAVTVRMVEDLARRERLGRHVIYGPPRESADVLDRAGDAWAVWSTDERAGVWGEKQVFAGESDALCELLYRMRLGAAYEQRPSHGSRPRSRHDDSHREAAATPETGLSAGRRARAAYGHGVLTARRPLPAAGYAPLDDDAVAVVVEMEWSGETETAFVAHDWTVYRVPGSVAFGDALEQFRAGFRTPRYEPWPEAAGRGEEA